MCWHEGVLGWECLISWHSSPLRGYTGWYGYSPTAIRPVGGEGEAVSHVAEEVAAERR
ncbi:hypothetical protein [Nonomuraea antri]|uniref:hypothetical protein n=1 Tax=Nonomuraea antri TaxID=2730852 RepID=UPI001C2C1A2A|nr:hypothetical protein [Nonomuraea antri]